MQNVQMIKEKVPPVSSEELVHLKNIECRAYCVGSTVS
jgi:hypothetical protein